MTSDTMRALRAFTLLCGKGAFPGKLSSGWWRVGPEPETLNPKCRRLGRILQHVDKPLAQHLINQGLPPTFYALRSALDKPYTPHLEP